MHKVYALLVICVSLTACSSKDSDVPVILETSAAQVLSIEKPMAEVRNNENQPAIESLLPRQLDTRITLEMLETLNQQLIEEGSSDQVKLEPAMLGQPAKIQYMITPKVLLKEDDQVRENYADYLDGAGVELRVKFD